MVSSNKKAPWATGVVAKALYGPCHSTQSSLCVSTVGRGPGSLLAFPSWNKPGNDPTKDEPDHTKNQGRSDTVDSSTHEMCHLLLGGRGTNHDIPHLAKVITWKHFAQVHTAIGWISLRPASKRRSSRNKYGQSDVEAFNAFKDVHALECITEYLILVVVRRLSIGLPSCYIYVTASVKRSRAWTPALTHSATKAAVPAMECGFVIRAPFMVARQAGASLAGSRKSVSGSPTCRATALIGLSAVVSANHTLLESIMAQSSPAQVFAPTHPHIVLGLSLTDPHCAEVLNALPGMADPVQQPAVTTGRLSETALIQLHADAHNALNMAVFYLRQPQPDTAAARIKAIQALSALRNLSLSLEA